MQRTTSALTAVVLGAALTASMAIAQQASSPDDAPSAGASAAKTAPGTAAEAANGQLYGMSVTRGARYLMRNGLDYLSYQQYDRALKFLREAEARVNDQTAHKTDQKGRKVQVELNAAEMTVLKQGIEAAQRGLRRASNAEASYALSDRSRTGNGFMPAKPSTQLAARNNQTDAPNRKTRAAASISPSLIGNDGDDDQGHPVRLASGEIPSSSEPAALSPAVRAAANSNSAAPDSAAADEPANMPETPKIPMVSPLPDLTAVNGSEPLIANAPALENKRAMPLDQTSSLPMLVPPDAASPTSDRAPSSVALADDARVTSASQSSTASNVLPGGSGVPMTSEPSPLVPQAAEASPSLVTASGAPSGSPSQDQAPGLPISDGTTVAPTQAPITPAPSLNAPTSAPTGELAEPVPASPLTQSTPKKQVIDLETLPSSATAGDAPQPVNPGGVPHQEDNDPVPASRLGSTPTGSAPSTATEPVATSPGANEDLPALPANLGRSALEVPLTDALKPQPTPVDTRVAAPAADESLPPLPADLGRSASTNTQTMTSPGSPAVSPMPVPALTSTTAPEQSAQPSERGLAQPADETVPVVPGATAEKPAPTEANPAALAVASVVTTPDSASPVGPTSPSAVPEANPPELPQLPDTTTGANPTTNTATAPADSAIPTTNPNLESQPSAAPANRTETPSDTSSLPPALTGGRLTSSTDAFIPDRVTPPSTLKPELKREVEKIARRQEEDMHRQAQNPTQPANPPRDTIASDLRTQTQMDISRAPSPAEARPIKAIPVPEDWVPLAPRNWAPQRKYWAAAATCHLPLYFQDPVLERYGHSVEHFVGPLGRFLTYPVDDPTQSTQRNQMFQPYFSAGLMGLQIIMWPYNLVMDPPWETQYDLGYYRPGDNIPTDTYWLPLHGYGPPLRGSSY